MINVQSKKTTKLEKLLNITNINEKKVNKLSYKEKQEYYRAKSKLGKIFFVSKDKNGKGLTYIKSRKEAK